MNIKVFLEKTGKEIKKTETALRELRSEFIKIGESLMELGGWLKKSPSAVNFGVFRGAHREPSRMKSFIFDDVEQLRIFEKVLNLKFITTKIDRMRQLEEKLEALRREEAMLKLKKQRKNSKKAHKGPDSRDKR